MCSLFVSACLTIQAVDAFKSASEVCAVEVIKFFTHFFLLNHINRLRISLFKLVWQDNETAQIAISLLIDWSSSNSQSGWYGSTRQKA